MMKKLKDFPFDVGDTIFVKEKFLTCGCKECEICTRENGVIYELDFDENGKHERLYSCTFDELGDDAFDMACTMTRKEARIFLEITDIKIERIQDISYEDLIKETGFRSFNKEDKIFIENQYEEYAKEWDRKHKKGSKWKDNPIVFVYSFKKGKK